MPSRNDCTNPSIPTLPGLTPPNAFSPAFLAHVRDQDETLTAAEAAVAGPWQGVPLPGWPGLVAVVREWECPGLGDRPEGIFCQEETARVFAAILPLVEREPLFHLAETPEGEAGFAVSAVYGEQGPCTVGWLRRSEPELIAALHLAEALVRRPASLAVLLQVAGSGALEQIGRILAPPELGDGGSVTARHDDAVETPQTVGTGLSGCTAVGASLSQTPPANERFGFVAGPGPTG